MKLWIDKTIITKRIIRTSSIKRLNVINTDIACRVPRIYYRIMTMTWLLKWVPIGLSVFKHYYFVIFKLPKVSIIIKYFGLNILHNDCCKICQELWKEKYKFAHWSSELKEYNYSSNNNYYNFNKYPVRLNDIIIITLFIIFKDSYLKKYFNNYNWSCKNLIN